MLEKVLVGALVKAFEILWEKYGPQIKEKAGELFTKLVPVIVGAIVKAVTEKIDPKRAIDQVIEADPDLPGVSNIVDLSEFLKGTLGGFFGQR